MNRRHTVKFALCQLFDMDDLGYTYHSIKAYIEDLEKENSRLKDELAEHDAEVIDQFLKEVEPLGYANECGYGKFDWVVSMDSMKKHMETFYQMSQENNE